MKLDTHHAHTLTKTGREGGKFALHLTTRKSAIPTSSYPARTQLIKGPRTILRLETIMGIQYMYNSGSGLANGSNLPQQFQQFS